eukprot:6313896-Amphidinium_carterae.1
MHGADAGGPTQCITIYRGRNQTCGGDEVWHSLRVEGLTRSVFVVGGNASVLPGTGPCLTSLSGALEELPPEMATCLAGV